MKPARVLREVFFPLTDRAAALAMLAFAALFWLADLAGLFGLWLSLVLLPAFFRYALYLLESRAQRQQTPVPGIELFSWVENFWSLFPLVFLCIVTWASWYLLVNLSRSAVLILLAIFLLAYPASLAVLGVTRSPLDSLNPVVIFRMIRACGADYFWIPAVLLVALLGFSFLPLLPLPVFLLYVAGVYLFFLLFSLTGAVLGEKRIADAVEIEAPLQYTDEQNAEMLLAKRRKVADHAYGMISRGNRDGGFAHLRQWIATESDSSGSASWFFNEMMRWETKDAALFFAQECLAHFLHHDEDRPALKLIARCLHENPRWKPAAAERQHTLELLERHKRDDLLALLRS